MTTPDGGAVDHDIAAAASAAADALASQIRGESSAQDAAAVAARQLRRFAMFSGEGKLNAAGHLELGGAMSGEGRLNAGGHLELGGGGAVGRLSAAASLTLGGVPAVTVKAGQAVERDEALAGSIRVEGVDEEPATASDLYSVMSEVLLRLDEIADGRRTATPAEVQMILLGALAVLMAVLQYIRPPG